MNFHEGGRKSAGSVLLDMGADIHEVKEQLGHSSITQTSNTYVRVFDARKRERAERINRAYTQPQESNVVPLRKASPDA